MPNDGSRWILTQICRLASVRAWKPFYRTVRKLGRFRILHSMLFSTSNFLEHLPDKDALRRTLQEALRCLKDRGRIICLGPNIRFLHGAYWDFWDHFLPLTDRSMIEILTLTGFTVERVEPRFLPYSLSQGLTPTPCFLMP